MGGNHPIIQQDDITPVLMRTNNAKHFSDHIAQRLFSSSDHVNSEMHGESSDCSSIELPRPEVIPDYLSDSTESLLDSKLR